MNANPTPKPIGMLTRVFWMMIAPLALVLLAYFIVKTGNGWMTGFDIGFLSVLAAMVGARWLEFRVGEPQTTDGAPATTRDLRRFAWGALVGGLLVWAAANLLGNHILVA